MIEYKSTSSQEELIHILELQKANLPSAVSSEEQKSEGFVTVDHDLDILTRMHEACPHIIAKDNNRVVGYALCMHPKFGDEIDVLKPMFREIASQVAPHTSYIVMGQVCIDKAYRKQGIFRKLYEVMQATLAPQFDTIITEVDARNARSLYAHYAVGFRLLHRYHADGKDWELIVLK